MCYFCHPIPDLNPIEKFWGLGKNHSAKLFVNDQTMRTVIQRLRDGWYGTKDRFPEKYLQYHKETDCNKLHENTIEAANKFFVKLCEEILGEMGSLKIDETHQSTVKEIPIYTLFIDLTDGVEVDEEDADLPPGGD